MNWAYAIGDTVRIIKEPPGIIGDETNFRLDDEGVIKELYRTNAEDRPCYKLHNDNDQWYWIESELALSRPQRISNRQKIVVSTTLIYYYFNVDNAGNAGNGGKHEREKIALRRTGSFCKELL